MIPLVIITAVIAPPALIALAVFARPGSRGRRQRARQIDEQASGHLHSIGCRKALR